MTKNAIKTVLVNRDCKLAEKINREAPVIRRKMTEEEMKKFFAPKKESCHRL